MPFNSISNQLQTLPLVMTGTMKAMSLSFHILENRGNNKINTTHTCTQTRWQRNGCQWEANCGKLCTAQQSKPIFHANWIVIYFDYIRKGQRHATIVGLTFFNRWKYLTWKDEMTEKNIENQLILSFPNRLATLRTRSFTLNDWWVSWLQLNAIPLSPSLSRSLSIALALSSFNCQWNFQELYRKRIS